MFIVEREYTKKDIYKIVDVPKDRQKGHWNNGSCCYNEDVFIFANVGSSGQNGIDHGNYWDKNNFVWFGVAKSNQNYKIIKKIKLNESNVHI